MLVEVPPMFLNRRELCLLLPSGAFPLLSRKSESFLSQGPTENFLPVKQKFVKAGTSPTKRQI